MSALRKLLGEPALMVHCLWGTKKCFEGWGKLTIDCMQRPDYLERLAKGNIGVALGDRSGGLCTIDIDDDEELQPFLSLNPIFKTTLMTRGKRGCNLWFRLRENCPPSKPLKLRGKKWGEFRSNGNQTIIYGQHPEGMRYRIVQRFSPITLNLSDIRWPEGITSVSLRARRINRTDDTEETHETDVSHENDATQEVKAIVVASRPALPEEAVSRAVPREAHENHQCLFRLAREVRTYEQQKAAQFDAGSLRVTFDQWHTRARPYLRSEQTADEYFMEFMAGYRRVKCLIGENLLIKAWEKAIGASPPPQVARLFTQESVYQLACFCRELQREWGDQPFFLSCRKVQELFDGISLSTASLWLRGLEACGVIKTVQKGSQKTNKASRFRYLLPLD